MGKLFKNDELFEMLVENKTSLCFCMFFDNVGKNVEMKTYVEYGVNGFIKGNLANSIALSKILVEGVFAIGDYLVGVGIEKGKREFYLFDNEHLETPWRLTDSDARETLNKWWKMIEKSFRDEHNNFYKDTIPFVEIEKDDEEAYILSWVWDAIDHFTKNTKTEKELCRFL